MVPEAGDETSRLRPDSYSNVGEIESEESKMRKPHNQDAGYVAERIFAPSGSHVVIYRAWEQGIAVEGKYAVVCSAHGTIAGESSIPRARILMKNPEFCEECWNQIEERG